MAPPCCSLAPPALYKAYQLEMMIQVNGMDLALNGKHLVRWKMYHVLQSECMQGFRVHVLNVPDKLCLNREAAQNSDDKP